MDKEFNKVAPASKKGWRIGQIIKFVIALICCAGMVLAINAFELSGLPQKIILAIITAFMVYRLIALITFPGIEYAQWGYIIEEDKVIIKHGIFFINTVIIPVIRVQNITLNQGPINRKLGLYNIEIALASGNHSIKGLDEETAKSISENLKDRLYKRIEERGDI